MKIISIIDFGCGNLNSLVNSLKKINLFFKLLIIKNTYDFYFTDKIILPGQGCSLNCLKFLKNKYFLKILIDFVKIKFLLGICIGKQIFFKYSYENNINCIKILKGFTKKFFIKKNFLKIPNVNWIKVKFLKNHFLFKNIKNLSYFYYLHSYYVLSKDIENIYAISKYNFNFQSIFIKNKLILIQFHPEKSGLNGLKLIYNFININADNTCYRFKE